MSMLVGIPCCLVRIVDYFQDKQLLSKETHCGHPIHLTALLSKFIQVILFLGNTSVLLLQSGF